MLGAFALSAMSITESENQSRMILPFSSKCPFSSSVGLDTLSACSGINVVGEESSAMGFRSDHASSEGGKETGPDAPTASDSGGAAFLRQPCPAAIDKTIPVSAATAARRSMRSLRARQRSTRCERFRRLARKPQSVAGTGKQAAAGLHGDP